MFHPHSLDASVKDMEAAAVAWAAELYAVPYFALKVVTDIGTYNLTLGKEARGER